MEPAFIRSLDKEMSKNVRYNRESDPLAGD